MSEESQVLLALRFAITAHGKQPRKDRATPYIVHPVGVMRILSTRLRVADPDVLAAGLLHDTLEDTATSYADVERHFGRRVADLVLHVTNPEELWHKSGLFMERKHEHILGLIHEAPLEAVAIKLADSIDNAHDSVVLGKLGVWSKDKLALTQKQMTDRLETMASRLKVESASPLVEAMTPVVYDELAYLRANPLG